MSTNFIMPGDFAELINDKAQEWGFAKYNQHPKFWSQVAEVLPMDRMQHELYGKKTAAQIDNQPEERRPGGGTTPAAQRETVSVIFKKRYFELTYRMPKELAAIIGSGQAGGNAQRGLENWLQEITDAFAMGRAQQEDQKFFEMFDNAAMNAGHSSFNNTISDVVIDPGGDVIYDGESWVGAAHPTISGGSYSNTLAATSFSPTNVKTARIRLEATNARDELGNRINIIGNLLLGPKDLEEDFEVYAKSVLKPGVNANDFNPGSVRYGHLAVPYLTDTDCWFLMEKGKGVRAYQGGAIDIEQGYDLSCRSYIVSLQYEFGFGVHDWRYIVGANLSTT
jgi:hypothetical protein